MQKIIVLLFFLFSFSVFAQKRVLIVDGACYGKQGFVIEPAVKSTAYLVKNFSKRGYSIGIAFGDYDSLSFENELNVELSKVRVKPQRSTRQNILAELDKALEMKTSDEFVLFIGSHGSPKTDYASHAICVYNESTRGNDYFYINDFELKQKLQNINSKGIKITILDDSCYGGNAVNELSQFGCVLSSTGPDIINMITGTVGEQVTYGTSFAPNIINLFNNNSYKSSEELWQIILVESIKSSNNPQSNNERTGIATGFGFGTFSNALGTIMSNIVEQNWDKYTMMSSYPNFYNEVQKLNEQLIEELEFNECETDFNKLNAFMSLKRKFPSIVTEDNYFLMKNFLKNIFLRMNDDIDTLIFNSKSGKINSQNRFEYIKKSMSYVENLRRDVFKVRLMKSECRIKTNKTGDCKTIL